MITFSPQLPKGADINLLWRILRADEGTFRGLIQDLLSLLFWPGVWEIMGDGVSLRRTTRSSSMRGWICVDLLLTRKMIQIQAELVLINCF